MVQNVLYTLLGIVIGIVVPFLRDVYQSIRTSPYDFDAVRRSVMSSWEGLLIAVVIIGLILWIAQRHDKKVEQSRKNDLEEIIKRVVVAAIKSNNDNRCAQKTQQGSINHKKPEDTDVNQ